MKIHITIEEPPMLTDSFGKKIKGPVKSLGPFETYDAAIKWLEFLKKRHQSDSKAFLHRLRTSDESGDKIG